MTGQQQSSKQELRKFGLSTGLALVLIFGLLLPWVFDHTWPRWPWVVAALLWFFALAFPIALKPVSRAWLAIGHGLGWFNTRLILGIMYYTVFLVVALFMRITGKDPMSRKIDKTLESYRVPSRVRAKDHVERPF